MIDTLSTEASNIVQLRLTIPAVLYEFLAHRIQENHATAVFLHCYILGWFSMQQ